MHTSARLAASTGMFAGFGGYLLVALVLTVVPSSRWLGLPGLLAIAALVGWQTAPLTAAATGLMGWLFYSGFVEHTHAHLGFTGAGDVVAIVALLVVAVAASIARTVTESGVRRTDSRRRDRSTPGRPSRGVGRAAHR